MSMLRSLDSWQRHFSNRSPGVDHRVVRPVDLVECCPLDALSFGGSGHSSRAESQPPWLRSGQSTRPPTIREGNPWPHDEKLWDS
jgi:hypothetical protein